MLLPRRPGISLKISALVSLMIVGEMLLLSWLLEHIGVEYRSLLILAFVVGTMAASFLLGAALDLLVTRPLLRLVEQVRRLPGESYTAPIEASGVDEPRELGEALEAMRQVVVRREEELRQLNQELEQRVIARTEQLRQAQRQLVQVEKLASVGKLAGGVAHEVNNPTGVILARSSYLVGAADDEGFDPDVIEDLEVIVQQAERIRTITGDLLSFARRSTTERAPVDLGEVCELTRNLLRHAIARAGVQVQLRVSRGISTMGRRDGLEQVVFNLVKNAVEATPAEGRILLSAGLAPDDASLVELLVDDSGPGVPEDDRQRVFDPFFTTKPVGKGTGLGLSVVYGIVEEHRGTLQLMDSPLGGARFRVLLPVADPDEAPEPPAGPGPETPSSSTRGMP